jgi:hypothetical protein
MKHSQQNEDPKLEISDPTVTGDQLNVLMTLYREVSTTWRALIDVRFKLLSLVPFVTVTVLTFLLPRSGLDPYLKWPAKLVCLLGFAITISLLIYDFRNSQLHKELLALGCGIEAKLGIKTGVFINRPKPKAPFLTHRKAIGFIYGITLAAWLLAFFAFGL